MRQRRFLQINNLTLKAVSMFVVVIVTLASCNTTEERIGKEDVKVALKQSLDFWMSLSINGGYAGIYELDSSSRYGEAEYQPLESQEIWIQPPGTPAVGEVFLRAYELTGDSVYLEVAEATGRALVWTQSEMGGWSYTGSVAGLSKDVFPHPTFVGLCCTFDDNTTQGALSFLMHLDQYIDRSWLTDAIGRGLSFIIRAQFDDGAWPQWYPLRGKYSDYYTFNDGAINDNIAVLLRAYDLYNDQRFLSSAIRGGKFIIASQLPEPSPGWAEQYNWNLEPAWARSFEPPAVSAKITAGNLRTLMDLYIYTKDERFLKPCDAAISWLERVKLPPKDRYYSWDGYELRWMSKLEIGSEDVWARFYEIGTNKPIYVDEEGQLLGSPDNAYKGYTWEGVWDIPKIIERYKTLTHNSLQTEKSEVATKLDELPLKARRFISELDTRGRWIWETSDGRKYIRSMDFVKKANTLIEYLMLLDVRR